MEKKIKLCYLDADSFIVYLKTEDIYVDTAKDAETRFHFLWLIDHYFKNKV